MSYQNWDDIRNATRRTPTTDMNNYAFVDFSGFALTPKVYFRKNFAFSKFVGCTVDHCIFDECNFSFALGMDSLTSKDGAQWSNCNFTGSPKSELPDTEENLKSSGCNVGPRGKDFTDQEINDLFNPEEG